MAAAYLTIDDSPSPDTIELCDFLLSKNVPAIFYCRGDRIEQYPDVLPEMIKRGFVIGNHGYAHKRAVQMSYDAVVEDILKCEDLIDVAYQKASVKRPGKFFRFPYLDRGCGAWIIDFDKVPAAERTIIQKLFAEGLYLDDAKPTPELVEKQQRLQFWLADNGFTVPFDDVNFPWYTHPEMLGAKDALYTFSTSDWMMTARHLQKDHPYKSIEDLKRKIDEDSYLFNENSNNIVLIHDQDELKDVFKALVGHMVDRSITFLPMA